MPGIMPDAGTTVLNKHRHCSCSRRGVYLMEEAMADYRSEISKSDDLDKLRSVIP